MKFLSGDYIYLNFVIKSPVHHAFGNLNQGLCANLNIFVLGTFKSETNK